MQGLVEEARKLCREVIKVGVAVVEIQANVTLMSGLQKEV